MTRISETPSPTGSQSPKLPRSADRMRTAILALARSSARLSSQESNTWVRRNVYMVECIHMDTPYQEIVDFSASLATNRGEARRAWRQGVCALVEAAMISQPWHRGRGRSLRRLHREPPRATPWRRRDAQLHGAPHGAEQRNQAVAGEALELAVFQLGDLQLGDARDRSPPSRRA